MKKILILLICFNFLLLTGCVNKNRVGKKHPLKKIRLSAIKNNFSDSKALFSDENGNYFKVAKESTQLGLEIDEFHSTYLVVKIKEPDSQTRVTWHVGETKKIRVKGEHEIHR